MESKRIFDIFTPKLTFELLSFQSFSINVRLLPPKTNKTNKSWLELFKWADTHIKINKYMWWKLQLQLWTNQTVDLQETNQWNWVKVLSEY